MDIAINKYKDQKSQNQHTIYTIILLSLFFSHILVALSFKRSAFLCFTSFFVCTDINKPVGIVWYQICCYFWCQIRNVYWNKCFFFIFINRTGENCECAYVYVCFFVFYRCINTGLTRILLTVEHRPHKISPPFGTFKLNLLKVLF